MKRSRRRATPAWRGDAPDWRVVEAATASWDGLRISGEDLERVHAFLHTPHAPTRHQELLACQRAVVEGLQGFDWGAVDGPTLFGLVALATSLRRTRDHGFPPGPAPPPVERWLIVLYRLVIAAEEVGLPPLTLARRALRMRTRLIRSRSLCACGLGGGSSSVCARASAPAQSAGF